MKEVLAQRRHDARDTVADALLDGEPGIGPALDVLLGALGNQGVGGRRGLQLLGHETLESIHVEIGAGKAIEDRIDCRLNNREIVLLVSVVLLTGQANLGDSGVDIDATVLGIANDALVEIERHDVSSLLARRDYLDASFFLLLT